MPKSRRIECTKSLGSVLKCADFIVGKHFEIETDHKPLVPLLGGKDLDTMYSQISDFAFAWTDSVTTSSMSLAWCCTLPTHSPTALRKMPQFNKT